MSRKAFPIICLLLILGLALEAQACRFYCAIGPSVPQHIVVEDLIHAEKSLKKLGEEYQDGWSVGYYDGDESYILRGADPSHQDQNFDMSVYEVSSQEAPIFVGHLRKASSGCVEDVPNPHPFDRIENNKNWIFGHNGGMKKHILIELIGQEYLDTNPPEVCTYDAPNSWIDSELYFIFLLKKIEKADWDVQTGLIAALEVLYQAIEPENRYLNFFLSDGDSIWVFRKGTTLYYREDPVQNLSFVSSTIPHKEQEPGWKTFPEDTLAVLRQDQPIEFISLVK